MNIIRQRPSPPLAPWVDCFWYSEGAPACATAAHPRRSALPTGAIDVVFNLHQDSMQVLRPGSHDVIRTTGAIVHGAQSRYFIITARVRGATAGIHFRPGSGAHLLGLPASELSEQHVALADLWGVRATELRTQLIECNGAGQVFQVLEQTLLARLLRLRGPLLHPAINLALRSFVAASGAQRVSAAQQATGYSARRFSTLFQQTVGLTPKRFCRIQRLRAVVEQTARGKPIEWAKVAADNGYFDQSHLNRDFRDFAGVTPTQYRPVSPDSALHMEL